ncbi:MAG: hypothetical protein IIY69_02590, partial [Clostridia bacterium]|nr:hypothetical protein [Clostridia bacterium]
EAYGHGRRCAGRRSKRVVVTFSDGTKMGLRHIENIWRATELGGSIADFGNKTITNIRYITQSGVYDYPVDVTIGEMDA